MDRLRRLDRDLLFLSALSILLLLFAAACQAETPRVVVPTAAPPTATVTERAPAVAGGGEPAPTMTATTPALPTPTESQAVASASPSPAPAATATRFPILRPTRPLAEQAAVAAARAALAEELGIAESDIRLVFVETVPWGVDGPECRRPPDGSSAARGIGFRVLLEAGGRRYEMRVDASGRHAVLCPGPAAGERILVRPPFSEEDLVAAAREHLAQRLDVSAESIVLVTVEEVELESPIPACVAPPGRIQPDRAYPRTFPGYRIVLSSGEVEYVYQSGLTWLVFCGRSPA